MTTELQHPPTDCITSIEFSPVTGEDLLLASSWDSRVRLYDAARNEIRAVQETSAPVLDCCFLRDAKCCVYGGLSKEVRLRSFDRTMDSILGSHDAAVRCVEYHLNTNAVFSGGWDHRVKLWDPRMKTLSQETRVGGKVFAMGAGGDNLIVGDSQRVVSIFDVRSLNQPIDTRPNLLRYQFRAVRVFPDGGGFALSSIEGRVAWEYLAKEDSAGQKRYAFKCHRDKAGGVETVYPVNALAFHPKHGTFATGGSDGGVSVWDGYNKRRLWRLSFPSSVTGLAFSATGSQLAIAASYDFARGPDFSTPPPQIILRQVKDEDVRPKTVGSA